MNAKHKTPGPGHYKTERKLKIKGIYNHVAGKGALVGELEYLAEQTSGPNAYKLNYSLTEHKPTASNLNRDRTEKDVKIKKNNSPSPHSYKASEALDKIRVNLEKINYKWNQSKEGGFLDQHIKKQKLIPGVGSYVNLEKAIDRSISKGVTARFKRGI